jgi:hypothetical protein
MERERGRGDEETWMSAMGDGEVSDVKWSGVIVRHAWYLARYRKCVEVFNRVESEGNCHHSKERRVVVLGGL